MDAIILAAGFGKRMKSSLPKVLHQALGKPLAEWVIQAARPLLDCPPVLVVGYGRDLVQEKFQDTVRYAVQAEQLGTGHAVLMAKEYLEQMQGYVLVLAGDMPLLRTQTLRSLSQAAQGKAAAVLTCRLSDPTGYGRVIRDEDGQVLRIVEDRDANEAERAVQEVNTSVYCFQAQLLLHCLNQLTCDNAQQEYYLTDCIGLLRQAGQAVTAYCVPDSSEGMGVNNQEQLKLCESILRERIG